MGAITSNGSQIFRVAERHAPGWLRSLHSAAAGYGRSSVRVHINTDVVGRRTRVKMFPPVPVDIVPKRNPRNHEMPSLRHPQRRRKLASYGTDKVLPFENASALGSSVLKSPP